MLYLSWKKKECIFLFLLFFSFWTKMKFILEKIIFLWRLYWWIKAFILFKYSSGTSLSNWSPLKLIYLSFVLSNCSLSRDRFIPLFFGSHCSVKINHIFEEQLMNNQLRLKNVIIRFKILGQLISVPQILLFFFSPRAFYLQNN